MQKTENSHLHFQSQTGYGIGSGLKTVLEIPSLHSVHVSQLQKWKQHLLEHASSLFEDGRSKTRADHQLIDQQLLDQLYQQIGKTRDTA